MSKVLIAGCGYVGTALSERLARLGNDVWGMRRNPEALPQSVHPVMADLTDPATLTGFPDRFDYVFYTAGAAAFTAEAYEAVYVRGVRNIIAALQSQGQRPKRILFTSSTGVYAQRDEKWVDEGSPTKPASFSGRSVLEGEVSHCAS